MEDIKPGYYWVTWVKDVDKSKSNWDIKELTTDKRWWAGIGYEEVDPFDEYEIMDPNPITPIDI